NALINRGHKARTPIARAADDLAVVVAKDSKGRKILIHGAKAVADPCAEGRTTTQNRASVHLADAIGMIQPVPPAGTDHRQIINPFRHVGEPVRNPDTTFAVLLPFAPVGQQRGIHLTHGSDDWAEAFGKLLSCQFSQLRFVIKSVEVAWTAF